MYNIGEKIIEDVVASLAKKAIEEGFRQIGRTISGKTNKDNHGSKMLASAKEETLRSKGKKRHPKKVTSTVDNNVEDPNCQLEKAQYIVLMLNILSACVKVLDEYMKFDIQNLNDKKSKAVKSSKDHQQLEETKEKSKEVLDISNKRGRRSSGQFRDYIDANVYDADALIEWLRESFVNAAKTPKGYLIYLMALHDCFIELPPLKSFKEEFPSYPYKKKYISAKEWNGETDRFSRMKIKEIAIPDFQKRGIK